MSEQAKKRLVDALVSLAKTTRGGYEGLHGSAISGGRRRRKSAGSLGVVNLRSGGALSGGALSGGRKRRTTRRKAGNLGVTNIASGGALSGGRKRRTTTRKAGALSGGKRTGGSKWIDFVLDYQKKHNLSYGDALVEASGPYKARNKTKRK